MKKHYFFLLIVLLLASCKPAVRKESRTVFALGTVCNIQLFTEMPQAEAEALLQTCTQRLEELERHLSANADSSTLIDINKASGISAVNVPADIYPLFERAVFFAEKTDGAFNPVIGSVVKLWNIGFENARKPEDQDIQAALSSTGYKDVQLTGAAVFLRKAGMKLDLGAIAKGFAADELTRIVKQAGIVHAVIDIGGTISVVGTRPDGKRWNIGIRDPRVRQGQPVISAPIESRSISTSGSYERYFEQDGVRYHHIIDPATGYPVRSTMIAVSVFSNSATDADALSTACFVLGYEKAVALLAGLPDTEALFIFDDNSVRTTGSLEKNIVILNSAFRFANTNENAANK
ncbi:FAD:protein FMN transferase [Treponema sp. OMZ 857]|uniref:FAD:protein FMN transferase n=1 Tax=Treponema sp. OMZ 857 TaxID=1643513 RepID=UPI0020A2773D|nr:FAD:protein FMN transferase [Treponema sp. OMZ 857]UTC44238.1 FAD:protein FMN transferase [Treponema sp. OMZ 857]